MKKVVLLFKVMMIVMMSFSGFAQDPPPLIDRDVFFDDPEISGAQLSPDGNFVSFLRPLDDTRNIWVKPQQAAFEDAIPVTNVTTRPIMGYFWSRDGRYLLYVMDDGGDENFNIYAVNPADATEDKIPEARNITNMEGVRAQIFHVSRQNPDLMFVGLNQRDPAWHDLYRLTISSGELEMVRQNDNRYTGWIFDHEDNLRLAMRTSPDGTSELLRLDPEGKETVLYEWGVLDTAYPIAFKADNQHLYFVSNVGDDVNLTQLYLMDVETGNMEFEERDPEGEADFGSLYMSDKTHEVLYTSYTGDYIRRYFRDEEFEEHYQGIKNKIGGNQAVSLFGPTREEDLWLVSSWSDRNPGTVYLYDMENRELNQLYETRPELDPEHLSPMTSIRYPSSDGVEIQAYLTLPAGYDQQNLPLVVHPHGGPWARDTWGYRTFVQFMANRGYAVLQPNFRGSTGFGKELLNAGNNEWGQLMQDDITWGVKYLIDQGIVDPERVAIYGGSYGGYATLAGLAFTPEVYAAGVSFVGPSNLITLLNSIPPYWEAGRITMYSRMGDPNTAEGKEQLQRQSPLNAADQIQAPLMVVQGENDPRVNVAESEQIVIALRERGYPVEYLNAPDEGHGFARPLNMMAFVAAMEKFLAEHIGGRYQQSMSEEVKSRLEEITVDVSTVEQPD